MSLRHSQPGLSRQQLLQSSPAHLRFRSGCACLTRILTSVLFVVMSAWALGYAFTLENWNRLWIVPSSAFVIASRAAQWSPIVAATVFIPCLGWIFQCKPTLGLAAIGSTESKKSLEWFLYGGLALWAVSLFLLPDWPVIWIRNIAGGGFTSPIVRLGGPFILLAALRWKRPEARLLILLALVPQTSSWYEALMPMLIAQTKREVQVLSLASSLGYMMQIPLLSTESYISAHDTGVLIVAFCYLPAVIVVLRKANEGPPPAWLQWLLLDQRAASPSR